ncbi:threonine/serine ThrE exporter family protein [Paractinoplanes brasiliensis]|uniref:Uncharacterized membrane protein YjjP (DUF1212 family) n=1 Tax=Paractinoplanes brasiliensis TaxID=52695 RepID=A0A4R6JUS7_9ACTN|nr:threonine/serine exporter family protein [Actinoplanes brasiliensis]TDO40474.1 uncharacterized membrane protein YjjP (DUF1212 family) [Actinoplanes brasiliensis]GID25542.1 hypothetical protein Abr02nite_05250 [Actinoplanes brasiliensis]
MIATRRGPAVLLAAVVIVLALARAAGGEQPTEPPVPEPSVGAESVISEPAPTPEPEEPEPEPGSEVSSAPPPSPSPSQLPRTTAPAATPAPTSEASPAAGMPQPHSPAAQRSGIAVSTLLVALGALLVLGAAAYVIRHRAPRTPRRPARPQAPLPTVPAALLPFLVTLGRALIDSGEAASSVQRTLGRVASVNGVPGAEVVVLATALFVTAPALGTVQTAVSPAGTEQLRLDQMHALHRLVRSAERGRTRPADGLDELDRIRRLPPAYPPLVRVAGYTLLTTGLALVLRADWTGLLAAALLGVVVGGLLQLDTGRAPTRWQPFLPFVCAFGAAGAAFLLVRLAPGTGLLAPLAAPLVNFLPGALLTTAAIELATGQMISGAARLASGSMRLFLLALGITAASELVGVDAIIAISSGPLPSWTTWLGVAFFGVGVVLHNCARWASLGWLLLVLYVAYAGQVVGGFFLGGVLSAFVGAVLMTPVARLVARAPNGPPAPVSVLPAFWLLVPGALGLLGVTEYLGTDPRNGIDTLVTTAATMVAVALGVLLGSEIRRPARTPAEVDGRPQERRSAGGGVPAAG